jgi:hypothetical protein
MSEDFATRCAAAVAAVPHHERCKCWQSLGYTHPHLAAYHLLCDCDRDARIGRGMAALGDELVRVPYLKARNRAERIQEVQLAWRDALAAFAEASR